MMVAARGDDITTGELCDLYVEVATKGTCKTRNCMDPHTGWIRDEYNKGDGCVQAPDFGPRSV